MKSTMLLLAVAAMAVASVNASADDHDVHGHGHGDADAAAKAPFDGCEWAGLFTFKKAHTTVRRTVRLSCLA